MQDNNQIVRKTVSGLTMGYKTYMRHNTFKLIYKNVNIYREIGQVTVSLKLIPVANNFHICAQ